MLFWRHHLWYYTMASPLSHTRRRWWSGTASLLLPSFRPKRSATASTPPNSRRHWLYDIAALPLNTRSLDDDLSYDLRRCSYGRYRSCDAQVQSSRPWATSTATASLRQSYSSAATTTLLIKTATGTSSSISSRTSSLSLSLCNFPPQPSNYRHRCTTATCNLKTPSTKKLSRSWT